MRRSLIITFVAAICLTSAPAALATTETAHAGDVTATFTFQGKFPNYHGQRLEINQGGTVFYDEPVTSKFCGNLCAPYPSITGKSAVDVVDLEHNGQPDVVLDLYSGGAHCCTIVQIFSFDPGTMTYAETETNFGDPDVQIVDLRHNGRFELLTADDTFAYEFTDFAGSGMPIKILTFSGGQFANVTRTYPELVAKNAAFWLKAFKQMAPEHYSDSVGVIAAWAADEYLLGHVKLVNTYLAQQAKQGHLNSPLYPQASGQRFITKLKRFLRAHGY
ncbi:MAG TPA: hypothetical protein VMF57_18485 [Solirubrobacteraceae bacterium]|nr:hypothetical protein [Solirubrobacteraceae bacterium]